MRSQRPAISPHIQRRLVWIGLALLLLALPFPSHAQDLLTEPLPTSHYLNGFAHIYQQWNNCGPATLTMALTHFGVPANQDPAANWLKPNPEDRNVSPWQMEAYVAQHIPGVNALTRIGGDIPRLKELIANGYPVLIEAGYDPEPDRLGWMGHYLLVYGYDDVAANFTTHDSYSGPGLSYSYAYIDRFWSHFNRTYLVLYEAGREAELMQLLAEDADPRQNAINAYLAELNRAERDADDPFLWHNLGSSLIALGEYEQAAIAFDEARRRGDGLPWRMTWYQFGIYEAYLHTGRFSDLLTLIDTSIRNGSEPDRLFEVEETYYYLGRAREAQGDRFAAARHYRTALELNPNFLPAQEALDALG